MQGLVQGKVAVITGAGSGLGRAASLLFARHGAKVVAVDIDASSAQQTASQIHDEGGIACACPADVADEAAVERAVALATTEYGRLDIMYNNAGITIEPSAERPRLPSLVDTPQSEMTRLIDVNVRGVLNGCRAAIRRFDAQGDGGVIVNTNSVSGLLAWGGVMYGATKGAITIVTRTLALEVAAKGIRVNSVCPAAMLTHFAGMGKRGPVPEEARKRLASMHPLGRTIDPMDCANAALFLASDLASNITGVNLPVDGGLSAGVVSR